MALPKITYDDKVAGSETEDKAKFFDANANQIKTVVNAAIDKIEEIEDNSIDSPNPFYGRWTTLLALSTAHPTGEENAWAIIDAGSGITPQIAAWDNDDDVWEIVGSSDIHVFVNSVNDLPGTGASQKDYITLNDMLVRVWHNGQYKIKSPITNSTSWHQKTIKAKAETITGTLDLPTGFMAVLHDGVNIKGAIFDEQYSNYVKDASVLFTEGKEVYMSWANLTQTKNVIAKVSSFASYEASDKIQVNFETAGYYAIPVDGINGNDVLQLFLPQVGSGGEGGGGQSLFLGTYTSLLNLTAAHPSPLEGSKANIDAGIGEDVREALWDNNDDEWILGGVITGDMSASTYDPANKAEQVLTISDILDEDDMSSDSANKAPSQQSVKAYVDNLPTPTENEIKGTKLTASVATTYNIDLDSASDFHLTMTADTDFTFTNTPTGDEVRRCKVRLTGEFAPTWTQAGLNVFGDDYDGTKWNDVLVEMWLDGTIKGLLIFQQRETA